MIPAGYMAKRMQKPKGFHVDGIADVYSVSSCINDDFADYIEYWKHNGHWLLIHPRSSGTWQRKILLSLAERPSFTTKCTIWSLMLRVGVLTEPSPHFLPTLFRRRKKFSKVSTW